MKDVRRVLDYIAFDPEVYNTGFANWVNNAFVAFCKTGDDTQFKLLYQKIKATNHNSKNLPIQNSG